MKLLTALLFAVGIISNGKPILSKKTTHQLKQPLHSINIAIDGYLIKFDDGITIRQFISDYNDVMTITCAALVSKPTIPRYRTNKGFMT